jgi:hypothetical protein
MEITSSIKLVDGTPAISRINKFLTETRPAKIKDFNGVGDILMCGNHENQNNLIYFDDFVLSIKYVKESGVYYGSLTDINNHYKIDHKAVTDFKRKHHNESIDKTSKWIKLEFIFQYLMESSMDFSTRFNILGFNILTKSCYETKYSPENLNTELNALVVNHPQIDSGSIKTITKPKAKPATKQADKVEHKLIACISDELYYPRFIEDSKKYESLMISTGAYISETIKKKTKISPNPDATFEQYKSFFGSVSPKIFDPADWMVVSSILKNNIKYHICIIKEGEQEKCNGIKTKKVGEITYTSNKSTNTDFYTIKPNVTMKDIMKTLEYDSTTGSKSKIILTDKTIFDKYVEIIADKHDNIEHEETKRKPTKTEKANPVSYIEQQTTSNIHDLKVEDEEEEEDEEEVDI